MMLNMPACGMKALVAQSFDCITVVVRGPRTGQWVEPMGKTAGKPSTDHNPVMNPSCRMPRDHPSHQQIFCMLWSDRRKLKAWMLKQEKAVVIFNQIAMLQAMSTDFTIK